MSISKFPLCFVRLSGHFSTLQMSISCGLELWLKWWGLEHSSTMLRTTNSSVILQSSSTFMWRAFTTSKHMIGFKPDQNRYGVIYSLIIGIAVKIFLVLFVYKKIQPEFKRTSVVYSKIPFVCLAPSFRWPCCYTQRYFIARISLRTTL